ncbi:MAG: hypothetical protein K0V04_20935 [Deltaproteobacteria bacterium]|nr:hypothetical protein [Deltaproteobacteria bacterium]
MFDTRAPLFALCSLPLLAAGCGALDGQEDAGRGMTALTRVLGVATPAALTAANNDRPDSFRQLGGIDFDPNLSIDTDVDCPDGGKLKLEGNAQLNTDLGDLDGWSGFGSLALEFDLDVKLRRCKVDGVKMRGDLHYSLAIDVDGTEGSASLEWGYSGDVTFRGDVKGRCEIDMFASASTGAAFSDIEVRAWAGSMCGLDAEDVSDFAEF